MGLAPSYHKAVWEDAASRVSTTHVRCWSWAV